MKGQKLKIPFSRWLSLAPFLLISLVLILVVFLASPSTGQSLKVCSSSNSNCKVSSIKLTNGCGSGKSGYVKTSIDFGCYGNSCGSSTTGQTGYCGTDHNGITDLLFAVIRFLSDGVGLVVVASVLIGGIQYITSGGDPHATQAATKRLTSALLALLLFIFAYAILNYVIPNGLFNQ